MKITERLIVWLSFNQRPCEERDLMNYALEELEQAREQLKALCDGVNRRCGADANQLPLVSLDKLTARLAEAEARYKALLTTVHGAHELLSVVVDDLAEAAKGERHE